MKRKKYKPEMCGQCWLSESQIIHKATRTIKAPGIQIAVCEACFKNFIASLVPRKREEAGITVEEAS